ncbi:putative Mg2+ transporter-C (MgtC) family protein [Hypnocyclicus thermotrophus]|uniref:Mg2+ transporter-C (MgtC) family protein n=1 Tax=Hypnocyclicus thermotrophus TaxID=1627895 RepID=A0AA46I500_9FUSO|nr:MgtC/SapB family protein [Hypnocyclicus thermotrophus]TDT68013.1 putative Mg2+ transporter-C (MgtC) family protein [Hypnocyclicus thermotrophus]
MYNLEVDQMFARILVAIITGAIIGLEREIKNKPAGFITHTVLCVGAAIISMIQIKLSYESVNFLINYPELSQGIKIDTGRLIAQVVSGVGFLGAGTIIQNKGNVRGITTAATLWLTACLGIAVGLGYFTLALGTAIIITGVVMLLKRIEVRHIEKRIPKKIIIEYKLNKDIEKNIKNFLEIKRIKIYDKKYIRESYNGDITKRITEFSLMMPKFIDIENLINELSKVEGILKINNVRIDGK